MSIERQSEILRNEVLADPLGRGYSGMTDQQVADDLNTTYRTRNRTSMSASEILNAVDVTEYNNLATDADRDRVWQLLAIGNLNPFGVEATLMVNLFGGGSNTITTLNNLRVDNISRAEELGFPRAVVLAHVGSWRS